MSTMERLKKVREFLGSIPVAGVSTSPDEALERLKAFVKLDTTRLGRGLAARKRRVEDYLHERIRRSRSEPQPYVRWIPRSACFSLEERCRRHALRRGWGGMILAAAYAAGVRGVSRRARVVPEWGISREQRASYNAYSKRWHRENGPARWQQHRAAAMELSETRMRIVGETSRGRRVEQVLRRSGRGGAWVSDDGGITATPLSPAETHWLVKGRDCALVAARNFAWLIEGGPTGPTMDAIRRIVAGEVEALMSIDDVEMRRILADIVPADRLAAAGREVSRDDYGILLDLGGIRVCRVVCPSTGRVYLLRVPPECRTAHQAVAWTFGMRAEEYRPSVEA